MIAPLAGTQRPAEDIILIGNPMAESHLPDIEELRSRLGGSREAADSLLEMFAKMAPSQIGALRDAVAASDTKQAKYVAHSLKGSLLWIGANGAAEAAREVEAALGENGGDPTGELDRLTTAVTLVVQAITSR